MKLLFDEQLSPRLAAAVSSVFPESNHVSMAGLSARMDQEVWLYAKENGFALVSKDSDFFDLSLLRGSPPKVVWIRRGNCSTDEIQNLLTMHLEAIQTFLTDPETHCIELL